MPQGSGFGPLLFAVYVSIRSQGISYHCYADDIQPQLTIFWMAGSFLQSNTEDPEVLIAARSAWVPFSSCLLLETLVFYFISLCASINILWSAPSFYLTSMSIRVFWPELSGRSLCSTRSSEADIVGKALPIDILCFAKCVEALDLFPAPRQQNRPIKMCRNQDLAGITTVLLNIASNIYTHIPYLHKTLSRVVWLMAD